MSDDDVQLDRRFLELKRGEEDDAARDLPLFLRDVVPWDRVLEERCAVILGEAGTGKTTEFRLRRKLLAESGQPAFFLAVEELATKQVTEFLDSDEEQRFSAWESAETIAYFFLDAVDEARLRNAKSLPSALRNLVRALRGKLVRSRILISCRVSDWRAQSDRREIQSILLKGDVKQEIKVFALAPLVEAQVVLLAKHYRVGDVEAFMREARRVGAHSYLERPGDVASLVGHWREHGMIGTYTQLIESNVDRKLRESNPDRKPSLTPVRAKVAATALAGLATLQRKASFVLPDGELDPERAATSLDPHAVLPNLSSDEIAELLMRPLFDEATYGRVRIHHRSVSEYLTARWLSSLMQQGLDPLEVERLLFQQTPSGPALPPEVTQAAAWLAAESPFIRDRVMAVAPLALLEGGDPSALPDDTKRAVLNRLAEQYEGRQRLFRSLDRVTLRRLATSSIAQTINELLAAPDRPAELLETLLRIVIEGNMEACASAVTAIAVDLARPAPVRADAIEAVAKVGTPADKVAAVHALLSEQDIDPEIGGAAVYSLFPTPLDVPRFLELLGRSAKPPSDKTTALERAFDDHVYERTPAADRARLFSGILDLVQDPAAGEARYWLLAPFARVVVAHASTCDDDVGRHSLRILDQVARGLTYETRYDLSPGLDELSALLQVRPELRRFLFWEQAAQLAHDGRGRPTRHHAISPGHTPLWRMSAADLDWLEHDALSREHIADRLLAFDCFMSVQVSDERAEEVRARSERLAASHPALRTRFERQAKRTRYVHPQEARWARQLQVWENSRHQRHSSKLVWLREHLEELRRGELQGALIWLLQSVRSSDTKEIEVIVRELTDQLDAEIAQAAEEGWRRCWRTVECPLPHEKEKRNIVSNTAMLGLAGISADLRQGLDPALLSAEAATQAARLATHTLNRFPLWIETLVRHHGPCVQAVFGACIRADYAAPAQHHVLSLLAHAPQPVQEVCAPILGDLIQAGDPADTRVLKQAFEALLSQPAHRAKLARLAPERCAGDTSDLARFALWWAVWFAADPNAAVENLETQTAADGDRAEGRVLVVCDRLWLWRERHQQADFELPERARALTSFLRLVLTYVHPSGDVNGAEAHYVEVRDHAEWFRGLLIERLAAIPGQETVDGLVKLANDPQWPEWRDWLLSLAERRRADDLTVAANDVAAKLLKAYQTHGLAAPEHLAEAGLRTISMTADREHPNTEPRPPMQKHTILFLAANPSRTDPRALDREARAIQVELERSGFRDSFELVTRWAVEPLDLLRELRKLKPTVVHFSGHGRQHGDAAHDTDPQQHGLFFQGSDGSPRLVSTDAIKEAFGAAGGSVKLVVLSACYSEPQAEALLAHVDCVIGMSDSLSDEAARSFAIGFYGGLGERESVAAAFKQGRAAIGLEGLRESDRPQIKIRAGVDVARVILAAALRRASEIVAGPGGGPQPSPTMATPAPSKVDIGILTIRDDEFRAVLGVFPDKTGTVKGAHREYTLRHADAGKGERYTITVLRQAEQGLGEAQTVARDLLEDLAPRLVLVVGIAGALPSDDVTLGDVVLSTRIHDFTVEARKTGDEATYAATGGPIDRALANAVADLANREDELGDWTADLPERPEVSWTRKGQLYGSPEWQRELRAKLEHHYGKGTTPRAPVYVAGPIASSDRLVKDPSLLIPWLATARNLLAVEMESGGVYRAVRERCPMLAIRGLSDIVGLKRADAWTKYACASAAAFTRAFLRTRPIPVRSSVGIAADPR